MNQFTNFQMNFFKVFLFIFDDVGVLVIFNATGLVRQTVPC